MRLSFSWFFSLEQSESNNEGKAGTTHYASTAHSKFRFSCVLISCWDVGSQSDWHLLGDFASKGRNWQEWKKSNLRESHFDGPLLSGTGTRRQGSHLLWLLHYPCLCLSSFFLICYEENDHGFLCCTDWLCKASN